MYNYSVACSAQLGVYFCHLNPRLLCGGGQSFAHRLFAKPQSAVVYSLRVSGRFSLLGKIGECRQPVRTQLGEGRAHGDHDKYSRNGLDGLFH